jgi:type I restriction enzyme S subunit
MSLERIDRLFNFEKGILQSSKCTPGEFDFITAASDWKTHNEYSHDCEALVFAAAASGSLGRTHYVNGKFISSDLCFIITPKDNTQYPIDLKFYHLVFNELKDEIVRNTKAGTSKEAIGLGSFGKYELPYLNIETQEKIRNQYVELEKSKKGIFTELTHQLSLVKQLRQSFLREAIHGKLVAQNTADGNAKDLLKIIGVEKAKSGKKEKLLLANKKEEIPFEIPENWVWCRLGEILNFIDYRGKTPTRTPNGVRLISAKNIRFGYIDNNPVEYIAENQYSKWMVRGFPKNGDILFVTEGHTMGFVAQIELNFKYVLAQRTICFQPYNYDYARCIYYFLMSPDFQKVVQQNATGAAAVGIKSAKLKEMHFPLPPLPEQQRIVEKLDELMRICDELEQSIKASQGQNEKLLQQVLREALKTN